MTRSTVIGLLLLFYSYILTFAQTNWTKYDKNPVHWYGAEPTVILDNDTLKMWFAFGMEDSLGVKVVIGYATSLDGINWTDYESNPVLDVGEPGTWDSRGRDTPSVVKDSCGYKLWYTGTSRLGSDTMAIGLATSSDGINWISLPDPVITSGSPDSWEGRWIESPCVIFDEGNYKMWYTGMSMNWQAQVGYAISPDGIDWQKYSNNPVLKTGDQGSGEDFVAGVCTVVKRQTLYEMWYCGVSFQDMVNGIIDTVNIGYAVCTDGIHWEKYIDNPVITTYSPTFDPDSDPGGPWAPSVIVIDDEYKMWYKSNFGICLATASITEIEEITNLENQISHFKLYQSYPNPFNTQTTIGYHLPVTAFVTLKIFDVLGRQVRTLVHNNKPAGNHAVVWDGKNDLAKDVSSGVYFCQLKIGTDFSGIKKLILLK